MGDIPRPPDAQLFLSLGRKQFGVQQVLDAGGADFAPDLARVAMRYALAHEHICDNKNQSASACLMWDGKVATWGRASVGGDSASVQAQLTGVESIASTNGAFAAQTSEGKVVTWGDADYGGDSASVQAQLTGVESIASTAFGAFAAKTSEGKVVTWGDAYWGGDIASVQAQLTQVLHLSSSRDTFTATLRDGSKVSWPGQ